MLPRSPGLLLPLLFLAGVGCSSGVVHRPPRVLVLAAASTADALEEVAGSFRAEQGEVEVKINPGPSNGLAQQIKAGAPADLFVSASPEWAEDVARDGLEARRGDLLSNALVLIVPAGNPAGVRTPQDLLAAGVHKVALAGESVPAGRYAGQALDQLGLLGRLRDGKKIARGHDVRSALNYVERREAEAGVVYATDAKVSGKVESVYAFGPETHRPILYTVTLLRDGEKKRAARQFYDYLFADAARKVFDKHGFGRPGK